MGGRGHPDTIMAVAMRRLSFAHMGGLHLDVGAEGGELIQTLARTIPMTSVACDVRAQPWHVAGVPCDRVDVSHEPLPYPDAHFDLVTSSGVVECVENYRLLLRELFRTLKGGGILVMAMPNALNLASRVRYLLSGFAIPCGSLEGCGDTPASPRGPLMAIPYFYVGRALRDAGFEKIEVGIDTVQKTSVGWILPLFPMLLASRLRFVARQRNALKRIAIDTAPLAAAHFSLPLLVGRSLVVSAVKPAAAAVMPHGSAPHPSGT